MSTAEHLDRIEDSLKLNGAKASLESLGAIRQTIAELTNANAGSPEMERHAHRSLLYADLLRDRDDCAAVAREQESQIAGLIGERDALAERGEQP